MTRHITIADSSSPRGGTVVDRIKSGNRLLSRQGRIGWSSGPKRSGYQLHPERALCSHYDSACQPVSR